MPGRKQWPHRFVKLSSLGWSRVGSELQLMLFLTISSLEVVMVRGGVQCAQRC